MFIRFDTIHECDRHTHTQTDGHRMTAEAVLMHSIVWQKTITECHQQQFRQN